MIANGSRALSTLYHIHHLSFCLRLLAHHASLEEVPTTISKILPMCVCAKHAYPVDSDVYVSLSFELLGRLTVYA
jgi:hypothetical protein